jgi:hypothetical protein
MAGITQPRAGRRWLAQYRTQIAQAATAVVKRRVAQEPVPAALPAESKLDRLSLGLVSFDHWVVEALISDCSQIVAKENLHG